MFDTLIVCTANRCRSPLAEHLFRETVRGRGWSIRSAGTQARSGLEMDPAAAAVLTERGHPVGGWRTSVLEAESVHQADLILVATTEHRRAVAEIDPTAARRTLLLLQFGAMLAIAGRMSDLSRLSAAGTARAAAATRPFLDPGDDWDLPDPAGGGIDQFRLCADRISQALAPLSRTEKRGEERTAGR